MGIQERKEREKELRRQSILHVAEKLFLEDNYINTTMEQIAEECEISRGTLYLYFKSKEEILVELSLHSMETLLQTMKETVKGSDPIERQIECVGVAYYNFYLNNRNHFLFMTKINFEEEKVNKNLCNDPKCNYEYNSNAILKKSSEIWDLIVNVLKRGIESGYFREDINPLETAVMLWSASNGVLFVLDHIHHCHNKEIPHKISTDSIDVAMQYQKIDMEKILYNLWTYIVNGIRKNK